MRRLLKADFYNLKKSKIFLFIMIGAVLGGFLYAAMFRGILELMRFIASTAENMGDAQQVETVMNSVKTLETLINGDYILTAALPFSEGYGLIAGIVVCIYASQQFGSGIIRNKIVSGAKRPCIYLSMLITSEIVMMLTMALNVAALYFSSDLLLGFSPDFGKMFTDTVLVAGTSYLLYCALFVCFAFSTQSGTGSLVFGIAEPFGASLVFSLVSMGMTSFPKWLNIVLAVFPTYQTTLLASGYEAKLLVPLCIAYNIILSAAVTLFGILKFGKSDLK